MDFNQTTENNSSFKIQTALNKKVPEIEKEEELSEDQVNMIIEKLGLSGDISRRRSSSIFNELDTEKKGRIKKASFLLFIEENRSSDNFQFLFNVLTGKGSSKSEKIISKLKKLKEKAYIKNDDEAVNDIDWIMKTVLDSNLNESELDSIEIHDESKKSYINENSKTFEYITSFTKAWDKAKKNKDLLALKEKSKKKEESEIRKIRKWQSEYIDQKPFGERLLQKIDQTTTKIQRILENIPDPNFDIFKLDEILGKKTLLCLSEEVFKRFDFFEHIDEKIFTNFITAISDGYDRKIAYHNDLHAADVLQTSFALIYSNSLKTSLQLQDYDLISYFLSGIIHDFKHPGFSNVYHINSKSKLSIRYNDASVLENFHVSQSFKIMSKESCNILSKFQPEEYRTIRRRIIDCVLNTDMAFHSKKLFTIKGRLESHSISNGSNVERLVQYDDLSKIYEHQQMILSDLIHASDISNPCKLDNVYDNWISLVFKEFFNQGDLEKEAGLPVSIMCDRETTNIEKSQVGFINFIVKPYWEAILNFNPSAKGYVENLEKNLKRYDEKLKNKK